MTTFFSFWTQKNMPFCNLCDLIVNILSWYWFAQALSHTAQLGLSISSDGLQPKLFLYTAVAPPRCPIWAERIALSPRRHRTRSPLCVDTPFQCKSWTCYVQFLLGGFGWHLDEPEWPLFVGVPTIQHIAFVFLLSTGKKTVLMLCHGVSYNVMVCIT